MAEFKPHYTPVQMFTAGIFGGTYFRPICSDITGMHYAGAENEFSFLRNISPAKLSASTCDKSINKYGVKSGQSLKCWEQKGWIHAQDPYGWVQWYCRYFAGRRSVDDERQIMRFENIKSRFGRRGASSEVIKQLLLQWGIDWQRV